MHFTKTEIRSLPLLQVNKYITSERSYLVSVSSQLSISTIQHTFHRKT